MEKKNLNISYDNQIYEVSRKDCGKLALNEISNSAHLGGIKIWM